MKAFDSSLLAVNWTNRLELVSARKSSLREEFFSVMSLSHYVGSEKGFQVITPGHVQTYLFRTSPPPHHVQT